MPANVQHQELYIREPLSSIDIDTHDITLPIVHARAHNVTPRTVDHMNDNSQANMAIPTDTHSVETIATGSTISRHSWVPHLPLRKHLSKRSALTEDYCSKQQQPTTATVSWTDDYQLVPHTAPIGVGSMGVIRKVKNIATGELFAMKSLRPGRALPEHRRELEREVVILDFLGPHEGIVGMPNVYQDNKNELHVMLELCSGGDLGQRLPYTEEKAVDVIRQLLTTLSFLHEKGVVHRDIKWENILFESKESDRIKLIDFGLSSRLPPKDKKKLTAQIGTFDTMAPEVLEGKGYDQQVDMWSVGVVAYMLLAGGTKPFAPRNTLLHCMNPLSSLSAITQVKYSMVAPVWKTVSPEARAFVKALLVKDPKRRLTANQALKHAWLRTS